MTDVRPLNDGEADPQSLSVRIANRQSTSLRVTVEPWAREYNVDSESTATFKFEGPQPADVEIHAGDGVLTIFAWPGAMLDDGVHR